MDTLTLAAGAAALAVASGGGYAVGARVARSALHSALAQVTFWKGEHRRSADALGTVSADRDQEKLRANGLQDEVNRLGVELFDAQTAAANMKPLYELGLRRRRAMDKQLATPASEFHHQVERARTYLRDAARLNRPLAPATAADLLGLDRRRAAYVLKAAGGTMIVTRVGKGAQRAWVPADAA